MIWFDGLCALTTLGTAWWALQVRPHLLDWPVLGLAVLGIGFAGFVLLDLAPA